MTDRTYPIVEDANEKYGELEIKGFEYEEIPVNQLVPMGIGTMVDNNELQELREKILNMAEGFGFPTYKTVNITKLDRQIGKVLYDDMNITPSIAATIPMWHFINLCLLPDFIYWRFGTGKDHFISDRRNYFGTQWWRYYIFCIFNDGKEVYETISDRNMADLYERTNSCGFPDHILEQYSWFNDLYEENFPNKLVKFNKDDLFRKTIKIYGTKIANKLYFSLAEEYKYALFSDSFKCAISLTIKDQDTGIRYIR